MRFTITYGQIFLLITLLGLILVFMRYARGAHAPWQYGWRYLAVYICLVVIARFVYFPWHLDSAGRIAPLHFDTARILPLQLNLLPFVHLFEHYEGWRRNLFGNIAMFIPVGIFWPLCFGKLNRIWKVVLAGFGYSLLIELSQLLFYERSTDIDDLLCNTLGALLGALLFFRDPRSLPKKKGAQGMNDMIRERAIAYIQALFAGNSGGHDAAHTLRVYRLAMRIADTEPGCDRQTMALAALLHDADDHKLFHTENNENARRFLTENNIPEHQIDAICAAINSVSFSQNRGKTPATLEGQIVQDADRLDALGAVGIARTFAYGGEHGRPLQESIQHFYDKLLLLKDGMHTAEAKRIAQERHAFLLDFLRRIEDELSPR